MADIIDKLMPTAPWEQGLANLGMGTPGKRFIVGTAIGTALVWAMRPSGAFNSAGEAKPWVLLSDPSEDSTSLPWWALAIAPGVIFSVFL